eukprot:scaffold5476_cov195-Alexandrium_tamarense.AAC.8
MPNVTTNVFFAGKRRPNLRDSPEYGGARRNSVQQAAMQPLCPLTSHHSITTMATINSQECAASASAARYHSDNGNTTGTAATIAVTGAVRQETLESMPYEELVRMASDLLNATKTCNPNPGALSDIKSGAEEAGKSTVSFSSASAGTDHRHPTSSNAAGVSSLSQPKKNDQMSTSPLTRNMHKADWYCSVISEEAPLYDNRVHRYHPSSSRRLSGSDDTASLSLVFRRNESRIAEAEERLNHIGIWQSIPQRYQQMERDASLVQRDSELYLYHLISDSSRFGMMHLAQRQRYQQMELERYAFEKVKLEQYVIEREEELNAAAEERLQRFRRNREMELERNAMKRHQSMKRYVNENDELDALPTERERRLQCLRENQMARQLSNARIMQSNDQPMNGQRLCLRQQLTSTDRPCEEQLKSGVESPRPHCDHEQAKRPLEHPSEEEEKSGSSSASKAAKPLEHPSEEEKTTSSTTSEVKANQPLEHPSEEEKTTSSVTSKGKANLSSEHQLTSTDRPRVDRPCEEQLKSGVESPRPHCDHVQAKRPLEHPSEEEEKSGSSSASKAAEPLEHPSEEEKTTSSVTSKGKANLSSEHQLTSTDRPCEEQLKSGVESPRPHCDHEQAKRPLEHPSEEKEKSGSSSASKAAEPLEHPSEEEKTTSSTTSEVKANLSSEHPSEEEKSASSSTINARIPLEHHSEEEKCTSVKRNTQHVFPLKLYTLLESTNYLGCCHVISWLSHGRAFAIHDENQFMKMVIETGLFGSTKFRSFTRNLNMWGFLR